MKLSEIIEKRKKYFLMGAIILVAGGYYWYNKSKSATKPVQYVTAAAEKGTLTVSVSGTGNVIVDQSTNIDPTITGTVTNLAVNIGDKVTKGQILFTIVNDQLSVNVAKSQSSYASAQTSLESAEASKKQASADYSDAKKSGSGKSSAAKRALEEKLEAARAGVISAQSSLNSAGSDLSFQRQQGAKRNVTSLISGTVNAINIKNGDDLSKLSSGSSRQVPMIIGDLGTLKAQVQVNEVDISNVSIGQKAMLTFDALPGFTATGKIEKMDSLGTLTQGVVTYNVTIGLDSLDSRIKPGMSASAAIITNVKQDVISVPNSAIKTQNGSSYVEILNSGTVPQNVNVETGVSNATDTEITGGLNIGDKVVTQTITGTTATSATTSTSRTGGGGGGGLRIPGIGGGGGGRPD